ncbi:triosephosphate isomerase [Candidatus Kaiserbacteria bacterium]|nr:triosephosphate isomerase [Candidatus Kaiserbacteria bacterium]
MQNLIIGNWKLYVNSVAEGKKLLRDIDKNFPRNVKATVVVCPQVALAPALKAAYKGRRISFGSQDVSFDAEGAHTGGISPMALASSGVGYVIVGHAERRATGDTDEDVSKKTVAAIAAKLHPIVCVGEKERDQEGTHFAVLAKNVTASLARIEPAHASKLTIAYDPLWAIGEPEAPPPRVVSESVIFIRKTLADMWGREAALKIRIIYGGSVTAESAKVFLKEAHVQGLLVGRASVDALSFTNIIRAAS